MQNDAGTGYINPAGDTPGVGTNVMVQNSQGILNVSATTVSRTTTDIIVNWSLTPKNSFVGAKNLFLYSRDAANAVAGWDDLGDWNIQTNSAPTNISVTPASGTTMTGTPRVLTALYRDANGYGDLRNVRLCVGASLGGPVIHVFYNPVNNKVYLQNDAGTGYVNPAGDTPGVGTNVMVQNSQGVLNVSDTTVARAGTDLTVNWSITPRPGFLGLKNLFVYCRDASNAVDGWDDLGDWTINNSAPLVGSKSSGTVF